MKKLKIGERVSITKLGYTKLTISSDDFTENEWSCIPSVKVPAQILGVDPFTYSVYIEYLEGTHLVGIKEEITLKSTKKMVLQRG